MRLAGRWLTLRGGLPAGCAEPFVAPTADNQQPAWDCRANPTCAQGAETIM